MQTSNENGEICTVEKIVGRRITNEGQVEYKIKWQGYSSSYNSWEPSTTLLCQSLIDTFNKKIDKKFNICTQKYIVTTKSTLESSENSLIYPTSNDFENREAERVVGTSGVDSDSGEALLLVKWKDASLYGILKQSIVRQHFPQVLLDFYEDNIILH